MEVFATLAGAAIQGQIVGVHHAKKTKICSSPNGSDETSGNHTDDIALQNTVRHRKYPFTIVSSILMDIVEVFIVVACEMAIHFDCRLSRELFFLNP